jgi:membrane protein
MTPPDRDAAPTDATPPAIAEPRTLRTRLARASTVLRFAVERFAQTDSSAMAANLAFRTLFGLLPVLVVTTIVTRSILGDGFDELVAQVVSALGLDQVTMNPPHGESGDPVPLGDWVLAMTREAARIDLGAIGVVGAIAVLFSAVWTMVAIESSFNRICRAPAGRPFVRRVLIYWFVLTAGPVLFAAIPAGFRAASGVVGHDSAIAYWSARAFSMVGGFVSLWACLAAAYIAVPNAKVGVRPALAGGFVATLLIELGKRFLGATLAGSFAASRLYGSLGLVPLFMMWVYLMWIVVLFGLQFAALVQSLGAGGRRMAAPADAPDVFEPAEAIGCFRLVCERFARGRATASSHLVRHAGVEPRTARDLLAAFERAGLAHRVDGRPDAEDARFAPARPASAIRRADALRAAFAFADGGAESPTRDDVAELREAQLARLGDATFAE